MWNGLYGSANYGEKQREKLYYIFIRYGLVCTYCHNEHINVRRINEWKAWQIILKYQEITPSNIPNSNFLSQILVPKDGSDNNLKVRRHPTLHCAWPGVFVV